MEAGMIAEQVRLESSVATAVSDVLSHDRTGASLRQTLACSATIDLENAVRTDWSVVVIGAGPAGALAARQLAMLGLKTLLVDKNTFPRPKVCGGCISGLGRHVLERVGLGSLVEAPEATALDRFELAAGGRRVSLALPLGAAISRFHFDAALVRAAVAAGAEFLPETTAQVRGLTDSCRLRNVSLQGAAHASARIPAKARSQIVLAADGLGRTSLKKHGPFAARVAAGSRIGLGASVPGEKSDLSEGTVSMSVGRDGYVGMVRLPEGTINIAAAVDPERLREHGPAAIVGQILNEAGLAAPPALEAAEWRGTGLLTRQSPRVAAKRLLLLGDAAGYVEPFTGEGMTWAMLSAVAIAPLAKKWLASGGKDNRQVADLAEAWSREHRALVARRQHSCRMLAALLRHPGLVRTSLGLLSAVPMVATPFIHYFWNQKELT
jgi:flavin-dependent dehydrogenase